MSRQSSIERYFKAKGSTSKTSQNSDYKNMSHNHNKVKRRNLSLIRSTTPSKSHKIGEENKDVIGGVINLCSDDEDDFDSPKLCTSTINLSQGATGSDSTLIYSVSPESPKIKLQNLHTPQKTRQILETLPKTPQSSSTSQSSQSTKLKSTPPQKFFSPTKNRTVVKRSPSKVKRSLSMEMTYLAELAEDEFFAKACEGMDDKSE